jgi:histidine kinase-like protein
MSYPPPYEPGHHSSTLCLTELPTAVARARRATRQQLHDWKLDELIDNSDQPLEPIVLRLRLTDGAVYAEVWDCDDAVPMPATPDAFDEGGRGLRLIEAFCDSWGFYRDREGGKVTWCKLQGRSRVSTDRWREGST